MTGLDRNWRAAGLVVQKAGKFDSDIFLGRDGTRASEKRIMSVLALAASRGVVLGVIAEGTDAQEALAKICETITDGLENGGR